MELPSILGTKSADYASVLLGLNIIFGSIIILIGTRLNPETKDVDIEQ